MTNAERNIAFLAATDAATEHEVLEAIAIHYGIDNDAARAEVTDADAEHLLDYLVGPIRSAVSVLMRRRGL